MKLRNIAFVVVTLGLAAAVLAGEDVKTKIAIAVVDSDGDGEVRFDLNSDDLGFDLHDMQEGENRSIVDESGRNILRIDRYLRSDTFSGQTLPMTQSY